MNKKGFTMIELIAVIIILGIIALITVPIVNNSLKNAKEKMLEEQKTRIVDAARKYALEYTDNLPMTGSSNYLISIDDLKKDGYIEDKDVLNPVTEEIMSGCIAVKYVSNKYVYKYDETCAYFNSYPNGDRIIFPYNSADGLVKTTIGEFFSGMSIADQYPNEVVYTYLYDSSLLQGYVISTTDRFLSIVGGFALKFESKESLFNIYNNFDFLSVVGEDDELISADNFLTYVDFEDLTLFYLVDMRSVFPEGPESVIELQLLLAGKNIRTAEQLCASEKELYSATTCEFDSLLVLNFDS